MSNDCISWNIMEQSIDWRSGWNPHSIFLIKMKIYHQMIVIRFLFSSGTTVLWHEDVSRKSFQLRSDIFRNINWSNHHEHLRDLLRWSIKITLWSNTITTEVDAFLRASLVVWKKKRAFVPHDTTLVDDAATKRQHVEDSGSRICVTQRVWIRYKESEDEETSVVNSTLGFHDSRQCALHRPSGLINWLCSHRPRGKHVRCDKHRTRPKCDANKKMMRDDLASHLE